MVNFRLTLARQPSVGGPPQDQPAGGACVDDRVGRDLVHREDEHDVKQVAAAVSEVTRPASVKHDYAGLAGHSATSADLLRYFS